MQDLISKISYLIFKLLSQLENDITTNVISLKDKKNFTELVAKLLQIVLKLQKMQDAEQGECLSQNDINIINDFLQKNKDGSERGI